jgi:hypothetical protein
LVFLVVSFVLDSPPISYMHSSSPPFIIYAIKKRYYIYNLWNIAYIFVMAGDSVRSNRVTDYKTDWLTGLNTNYYCMAITAWKWGSTTLFSDKIQYLMFKCISTCYRYVCLDSSDVT